MIGWVALAITAIVVISVFMRVDDWSRDWTTNFAKLDEASADAGLRPVHLSATPREVGEQIERWSERTSRWKVESLEANDNSVRLHLIHTTPLWRFADDVHVVLNRENGETILNAESRSRIGKGDLGQNPRNLRTLVAAVSGQ
jgi:uncharacterized protein (DUF1499 family)